MNLNEFEKSIYEVYLLGPICVLTVVVFIENVVKRNVNREINT